MPSPLTIGAFTEFVARLSSFGDISYDSDGSPISVTSVYNVLIPRGTLPTLQNVTGLPANNAAHPVLTNLRVSDFRFVPISQDCGTWIVEVGYSRNESEESTLEDETIVRITSRSWGVNENNVDIVCDILGNPIINSAGDPFDSVPQKTVYSPTVSFSRLESAIPSGKISLNGSINKTEITVLGVHFDVCCAKIKITAEESDNPKYPYRVNYEVIGRTNIVLIDGTPTDIGWDDAIIQAGYQFIDKDGKRYKFTTKTADGEEKEVSSPQLLDADGNDNRGGQPVLFIITSYEPINWDSLSLPG